MTYREAANYLEAFINYEKLTAYPYKESLKLERVRNFLTGVSNPQVALKCIHVAGTKGKGSTCAFISYILRAAGFKVGLYTSPHLSDFRERIRILSRRFNTQPLRKSLRDFEGVIPKKSLAGLVLRLKPEIEKYNRISEYGPLSFFEVYTTLAFLYFKEQEIDFAVLETGLGGRLDATNVTCPLVCAITPISYEHTQKLGNTLKEIATEKAGIIKRQEAKGKRQELVVISAPQEREAEEVIRKRCRLVGADLYTVGKGIKYKKIKDRFSVTTPLGEYNNLKIKLLGEHQLVNATVAVAVVEALRRYNKVVGTDAVRSGLLDTLWPGRCEVIAKNPLVVLDGAQNLASAVVLKKAIRENFRYQRLIMVLGISNDKDVQGVCRQLSSLADTIVLTMANNPRATKPEAMVKYLEGRELHFTYSVEKAAETAKSLAGKNDLILVCGSLFVVGEFRNALK